MAQSIVGEKPKKAQGSFEIALTISTHPRSCDIIPTLWKSQNPPPHRKLAANKGPRKKRCLLNRTTHLLSALIVAI